VANNVVEIKWMNVVPAAALLEIDNQMINFPVKFGYSGRNYLTQGIFLKHDES